MKQNRRADLLIRVSNVTGLRASQVVNALLEALCARLDRKTLVYVSDHGPVSGFRTTNPHVPLVRFRRWLPNAFRRRLVQMPPPSSG